MPTDALHARIYDSLYVYKLSVLAAFELVIAFSSVGYILVPPIAITLVHIPVIVGAFFFGPLEGMLLGGIFGLTSIFRASSGASAYADIIFSPFLSGQPVDSLLLAIGTRMLFGLLSGLLFNYLRQHHHLHRSTIFIGSIFCSILHAALVFAAMGLFFPLSNIPIIISSAQLNTIIGGLAGAIFILGIHILSSQQSIRTINSSLADIMDKRSSLLQDTRIILTGLVFSLLFSSLLSAFYSRAATILASEHITLSTTAIHKIVMLSIQFMIAAMALSYILSILFTLFTIYSREMQRRSEYDALTSLFNRATFLRRLPGDSSPAAGTFIIIDIDDFKSINDSFGHPFGDTIIAKTAKIISLAFGPEALLGRIGGDEFAVFLPSCQQAYITEKASAACMLLNNIHLPDGNILSASIGIACSAVPMTAMEFYQRADKALYSIKHDAKNHYAFFA